MGYDRRGFNDSLRSQGLSITIARKPLIAGIILPCFQSRTCHALSCLTLHLSVPQARSHHKTLRHDHTMKHRHRKVDSRKLQSRALYSKNQPQITPTKLPVSTDFPDIAYTIITPIYHGHERYPSVMIWRRSPPGLLSHWSIYMYLGNRWARKLRRLLT